MTRIQHAIAGLIVAALVLWTFGGEWLLARLAANWRTTEGVVTESRVAEGENDGRYYFPAVTYRYSVAGELYFGSKVSLRDWGYDDMSEAAAIVQRYPVGRRLTVHYNPEHPAECALEMTPRVLPYDSAYLTTMALISFAIVILWTRRRRRPTTQRT